jgi:MFS family permease
MRLRRDVALLFGNRTLRAFGFGLSTVMVSLHLEHRGLPAGLIGLALGVGVAAASLSGLLFAVLAAHIGRRSTLAISGLLMTMAGLDLAVAPSRWLLVLAGLTGMLGLAAIDLGPFATVEQATLADATPAHTRNRVFARYSVVGALAGAGGSLATALFQGDTSTGFIVYASLGLLTALIPMCLSSAVEVPDRGGRVFGNLRPLAGLATLFAMDAFGGGLVANSVIAYWLHIRFGASIEELGPMFAGIALLQAASYELAGRLGDRIGLINTMVVTHLPSNLLLLIVAFSPTLWVAIGLLLARFSLSQMDVPARQAYVVSIVPPSERAGAVASTGALRGVVQAFGPVLAGAAIQSASFGLPFLVAGSVKAVYDVALFIGFRARRAEHEAPTSSHSS